MNEPIRPDERVNGIDASFIDGFDVDDEDERWQIPRLDDRHKTRVPQHKKYH